MNEKRVRVLSSWEELQTIFGLIDAETKWFNRLKIDVEEHKKHNFVEYKSLPSLINKFEVSTTGTNSF